MITASVRVVGGIVVSTLLLAPSAWAQAISGSVTDNTGGILPGVTVTAASPVLIEQQRVAITDSSGLYTIVDLRPGAYTVTFSLPGFSTVIREGIELTTGFTANIDGVLAVGGIEETITVTGATPVVDVQNVRRQQVVTRELLEALPISTKHVNNLVTLTPGFTGLADVGGRYSSQVGGTYHGKFGTKVSMDGMVVENSNGNSSYQINAAVIEEMVLQTSGISAETNADGPALNVIPKEGGNDFTVDLAGFFANDSMEGDNLTPELQERGVREANKTLKLFDESVSIGGPIMRDRVWFFFAGRSWGFSRKVAGVYWNQSTYPGAPPTGQPTFLTPPGADRKVVNFVPYVDREDDRYSGRLEWYDSYLGRVTWQATDRQKFNLMVDRQEGCNCGSTVASSMQEYQNGYRFDPNTLFQLNYTNALTSRLLLEAGGTFANSQWNTFFMPGVERDHIYIRDFGTGVRYGASSFFRGDPNNTDRHSQRFSVSYVTGSHNFKTGVHVEELIADTYHRQNGNVHYSFRNGVPINLIQWATPHIERSRIMPDLGIYAQDQWVMDKLTLNLGVRFDWLRGHVPAQDQPEPPHDGAWPGDPRTNPWFPPGTRVFDRVDNAPNWKDFSPRLGLAYDVFGDGRTAVKASLSRYVGKMGTFMTQLNNPINTSVNSARRAWNDANGDYVPDCDLGNFGANGECGPINNSNFGKNNPNAIQWDPNLLNGGNGRRDYNWDMSLELQQEVRDGFSVTAGLYQNTGGYYEQRWSKTRVTDNLAVTPEDHDPFCITAPLDQRLPGGGGNEICGFYDVKPEKFGQVDDYRTLREPYGDDHRLNQFLGLTFDARLQNGIRFGGGFDSGRSIEDRCFVVDSPQELLHCRVETPWSAQTQLKLNGVIPLPYDVNFSATYQNLSGEAILGNYAASNAEVRGSLGRDLAGRRSSVTVPLFAPDTLFLDRIDRLDIRVSKIIRTERFRIQINLDAYNALNASHIRSVAQFYGSRFLEPNTIMDARLVEIGGSISF